MVTRVRQGWSVELGDGCYDAFLNAELLWVARRLYSVTESLSPEDVFRRVTSGEWLPAEEEPPPSVAGGSCSDWRLQTARVSHLSIDLMQYVCHLTVESDSVGFEKHTFIFEDRQLAEQAVRLDRRRKASSSDVMRCLSRSMDALRQNDILWVGHRHPVVFREIESLDLDLVRLPSSQATQLFQSPRRAGQITRVWVFVRERRVAAHLTLVHEHWVSRGLGILQHSLLDRVFLRWIPMAVSGGIVELSIQCDDFEWPWWIERDTKVVDDVVHARLPPLTVPDLKRSQCEPPSDDLSLPQRQVLAKWERSARARGAARTELLSLKSVAEEDRSFGRFIAFRCVGASVDRLRGILTESFGAEYASRSIEKARGSEHSVAFGIQEAAARSPVAVVIAYLFDTRTPRGEAGTAMLIDSFAVARSRQGEKIGEAVFHELCLPLAEELSVSDSYLVFAQCVLQQPGAGFWREKLDPTTEARSVMLQAHRMGVVPVQTASVCEARARTFLRE